MATPNTDCVFAIERMMAGSESNLGYVDFSGLANRMIESGAAASATFTLTFTDGVGQEVQGTFSLDVTPFNATVAVSDGNIWAWKMTGVTATVTGVEGIPSDAVLGLQWSADGTTWSVSFMAPGLFYWHGHVYEVINE